MAVVSVDELVLDARLQMREECRDQPGLADPARVELFKTLMSEDVNFPPVKAMEVGRVKFVYDGFHTLAALVARGRRGIPTTISSGTWADALAAAAGSNIGPAARSKATIRNAVISMRLARPEVSQRLIANQVGVDEGTVRRVLARAREDGLLRDLAAGCVPPEGARAGVDEPHDSAVRVVERNGTRFTMDTSNIGAGARKRFGANSDAPRADAQPAGFGGQNTFPGAAVDGTGTVIPESLRDVFACDQLRDAAEALVRMQRDVRQATEWAAHLRAVDVAEHLASAERLIRDALPYAVCPVCAGSDDARQECLLCMASGYLTEPQHFDLSQTRHGNPQAGHPAEAEA